MKKWMFFILIFANAQAAIKDNSFLGEEAFNQDENSHQFIQLYQQDKSSKNTSFSFEHEMPITPNRHQFSYSLSYEKEEESNYLTGTTVNYHFLSYNQQNILLTQRFSLFDGITGYEFMQSITLKLSSRWVNHWNIGYTQHTEFTNTISLTSSVIYLWEDNLNLLLELLTTNEEISNTIINPGLRFSIDSDKTQHNLGYLELHSRIYF